jgi:tape measure domain-containing protein
MSDERIEISFEDKINNKVSLKLLQLAEAAEKADAALSLLKKTSSSINFTSLTSASASIAKLNSVSNSSLVASEKIARSNEKAALAAKKLEIANNSLLVSNQKLNTEIAKTESAIFRNESAFNRAIIAENKAIQSENALLISKQKLNTEISKANSAYFNSEAALNKAVNSEKQLLITDQKLALETNRVSISENNFAASASRAELAALRLKTAKDKLANSGNKSSSIFTKLNAGLLNISAAANVASTGLQLLQKPIEVIKLADEYVTLENKLKSVGLSGSGLNDVMKKLESSSENTFSSLSTNVTMFSRLGSTVKYLGRSQQEVIDFTTSLNQAILLSGATAQEADASVIQLTQGMASGVLRGQELNSILEQLPIVADIIAKQMGVTRNQMRALGKDGKISADIILDSFKNAKTEISEKFSKQIPTVSKAFSVLTNTLLTLVGENGKGSIEQIALAIIDIKDALKETAPLFSILGTALEGIIKTLRAVFLGIEAVITGLIPLALAGFGEFVKNSLKFLVEGVSVVFDSIKSILPDSVSSLLGDSLDYASKSLDKFDKSLTSISDKGVSNLSEISDKLYEMYKYKPPEAGSSFISYDKNSQPTEEGNKRTFVFEKRRNYAEIEAIITSELENEYNIMGKTNEEMEIHNKLMDYNLRLVKGLRANTGIADNLTEIRQLIIRNIEYNKTLERQKQILDSLKTEDFSQKITDVNELLKSGELNKSQAQQYFINENPDLFKGTRESLEANTRNFEEMYNKISQLREADLISENSASQMRKNVWIAENESKFQTASEVYGNLASLQESTNRRIATFGKAAAVTQATIDGILAIQKALASAPPPANFALAASVGVATAANVAKIQGLPGFEKGGYTGEAPKNQITGVVHGKEFVMTANSVKKIGLENLKALQNGTAYIQNTYNNSEKLNSNTSSGSNQNSGNSKKETSIRIINVTDPQEIANYMNSSDGETIITNAISRNPELIKRLAV